MLAKQIQQRNLLMQRTFYVIRSGSSFGIQIIQNWIPLLNAPATFLPYSNWKQKRRMENGPYERERLGSDYYKVFINLFIYLFIYLFIWLGGTILGDITLSSFTSSSVFPALPILNANNWSHIYPGCVSHLVEPVCSCLSFNICLNKSIF